MQIWKNIVGAAGYQVSDDGQVRSLRRKSPKILKQKKIGTYLSVVINMNGKKQQTRTVHRLVAKAFIPNPDGKPEVNHINGDKYDNRAKNLEWVTHSENMQHAYSTGLAKSKKGASHPRSKLTDELADFVRLVYKPYSREFGAKALATQLGVCSRTIQEIIHGRTYKKNNE